MGANTDYFIKAQPAFATTLATGGIVDGAAATFSLDDEPGAISDGDAVILIVDRVNLSGTKTPSKKEVIVGIKNGTDISSAVRGVEGTAQAHLAGAVVEIILTAEGWNRVITGLSAGHNQNGSHKTIKDSNNNEIIELAPTSSAVNHPKITNAATGNSPIIEAAGDDTNIHLTLRGKGNALTKTSMLNQSPTTNTYKHNIVAISGYDFIQGSTTTTITKGITFGVTFASRPVVICTKLGYKDGSDPSHIGDFANINSPSYNDVCASAISTTGFTANINAHDNFGSTVRYGFSWVAYGELA